MSRFLEQSKQASLIDFLPHFGILGCFSESQYSISVVSIGILILGQHASVCNAKAYEKSYSGRHFCAQTNFLTHHFDV